jgi:type I restriction enzyme S subunit
VPYVKGVTPRLVRITDISASGDLIDQPRVGVPSNEASDRLISEGDLLLARSGATVGKSLLSGNLGYPAAFAGYLIRFRVDERKADRGFVKQFLNSERYWQWVRRTMRAGAQPNINSEEYRGVIVPLPDRGEQVVLRSLLELWDKKALLCERLIAAKAERKLGLVQGLIGGEMRFKEFQKETWRKLHLGDVLSYESRITKKPGGSFLAAGVRSHGKGVFLKPDFDADDIALDELFELRTGDLVVNITFGWEGAAAIVPPEADGALVSHRFPTFTFKPGVSSPGYFRHVIKQKRFVHEMGLASPGGAGRNRVMSKTDFLHIPVELPSFKEQERIAGVLNTGDQEIELLQKQLEALKEQKRGLMQKLLTGEVRVKV